MSGTYSGSDKRLAYLFENGGGGGGGTTVVANPSGEATDDLEKLQVGSTIYDIPTGGGGSSTLAGLDDVNISTPADGDVLKYDETNNEWVNGAGGSGGGELYLNTIYSETEEKVGYWTDGKPLYQRTLVYNDLSQTSDWTELDSSVSYEMLIKVVGQRIAGNGDTLGFANSLDITPRFMVRPTNGKLYYYTNNSIAGTIYITIQYTKTTDTPEVPQRGNVIYLPTIYSEDEREVGVWKDGKPIYQKTVAVTANIPYNNWSNTGVVVDPNADRVITIPQARPQSGSSDMYFLAYFETGGVLCVMNMRNVDYGNNYAFYITVQYTKSTDTAGSGSWTPSGAPAVHYSTNEQVVGTWIDGKTIYQKTVSFGNLSSGEQTVTMDLTNTETIIKLDIAAQVPSGAWLVLPMTYTDTSLIPSYGAISDGYNASTDNVTINIGSERSFVKGYITIQYTKSS